MHPPHVVFYWFFFDFGMYGYLLMSVYVVVQSILQYYLDRHLVHLTQICYTSKITSSHTIDGRNPANQLIGSFSHCLQGLFTSQVVSRISEPSTADHFGGCQNLTPSTIFQQIGEDSDEAWCHFAEMFLLFAVFEASLDMLFP